MIELTLAEIADAVGAQLFGDPELRVSASVETDSRLVQPGSLFVAKPGEVTDGHLFVDSARKSGAIAALVEHRVEVEIAQLVVADSVAALGKLAKFVIEKVRANSNLTVIGITGSNGKTTTKNMLGAILAKFGPTVSPIESYNNEVGAPISMLKIDYQTKYLVVEMGADGPGSIAYLADMAKPDIGVILKVGLAHVGEFGDISVTAQIKGELAQAIGPDGLLILNSDDSHVAAMANLSEAKTVWFGTHHADYLASGQQLSLAGTSFDLHWPEAAIQPVSLKILGEHHVMNALAAISVADQLGLARETVIAALEEMPLAERWRMQLGKRSDGVYVINDAYNASPESTKAALQTLAHLGKSGHRTIAVLGEMAELGSQSREQHDAIGRVAVRLNIDQVVVVGAGAKLIHMGATQEGSWDGESKFFDEIDQAFDYLDGMLEPGDLVLVKSSKSANLRFLGDRLLEVGQ